MKTISCDGNCEIHEGEVIPVIVSDFHNQRQWEFNYCENAIKQDEKDGFVVKLIPEHQR